MPKPTSFDIIVRKYRALRKNIPDTHILYCIEQNNLVKVIEVAAKAINAAGQIHGHQRRIGRKKLNEFAASLASGINLIQKVRSFDELHHIVDSYRTEKIGNLTVYDTSHRIGEFLKIYPDEVYLHSGTLIGAKRIFGSLNGKKTLKLTDFSLTIQNASLTPHEMEDILCIFKDEMDKNL